MAAGGGERDIEVLLVINWSPIMNMMFMFAVAPPFAALIVHLALATSARITHKTVEDISGDTIGHIMKLILNYF